MLFTEIRMWLRNSKLRLFASAKVISTAEEVMQHIVDTYDRPSMNFCNRADRQDKVDVQRAFSEVCGEDLRV